MRITAAFLAEKAEARANGLYVEGGVFPSMAEDADTGQLVVWLVLLVERLAPTDTRSFTVDVVSLEAPVADAVHDELPAMEVGEECLRAKLGYSVHELRLSRADVPATGWDAFVVTDGHGETFTLPFKVASLPAT